MRYRRLDANGDYVIGAGLSAFYIDAPEAVAQAVKTRLLLWYSEWFLDTRDGTNWQTGVLGRYTQSLRDATIRERVLTTPGVTSIVNYSSNYVGATRTFNVDVQIATIYGTAPLSVAVQLPALGTQ